MSEQEINDAFDAIIQRRDMKLTDSTKELCKAWFSLGITYQELRQ